MSGVWGFSAWMSLSRVGGSAKSPAAAIERRENVVPAGLVRPAKSNGLSATHRAKVKRQRWLSPRRNAMDSSCRSKEMSTNVAPLARNNSLASSTALLQIRFERETIERPGDVIHDDVPPARSEESAQPPAHASRAADH